MAQGLDELGRERHLVVVFDICSSTTILEDLKRTDNLGEWGNLLLEMKAHLREEGARLAMCLYKFIGDGWVLLFPDAVPKKELCALLSELCDWYQRQFDNSIKPLLSQEPSPIGLMFGIDAGELVRLDLDDQTEYVGRAINVASRLQTYTKELRSGPSYKVIFSKNSFNSPGPPPKELTVERTKISLRNISPATMECFVWQAFEAKQSKSTISMPAVRTEPPRAARAGSAAVVDSGSVAKGGAKIRVTDVRPMRIAPLAALGKWMLHRTGQMGAVVQFTNGAPRAGSTGATVVANATVIYRVGEKEIRRVKGVWLDGFDVAKFNPNDSRSLIVGVAGDKEFFGLEAVRTPVAGADHTEIRPTPFIPIPPKLDVEVRVTDANGRDVLCEDRFEMGTNPLIIARV